MSRIRFIVFPLVFLLCSFFSCDGVVQRQRPAPEKIDQSANQHLFRTQVKANALPQNSRTVVKSALHAKNPAYPRQNRRALVTKPGATVAPGIAVFTHATTIPAPYNGGLTPVPTVSRPPVRTTTRNTGSTAVQTGGTTTVSSATGSTTKVAPTTGTTAATTADTGSTTATTVSTTGTSTTKTTTTTTARDCDGGAVDGGQPCSATVCCRYGQPCAADATGAMVCGTSNGCTQGDGQTCDPNIFTNGGAACCAVYWTCAPGGDGVAPFCF